LRFDILSCAAFALFLSTSIAIAEVRIGIAAALSGSALPTGERVDAGANKAIEDLNANGGVLGQRILSTSVDDACNAEQAVAAARQLVVENVQFVVGHACSSGSIAGGPIYAENDIIMMSPASTNPRVTDSGLDNVFRVVGRDDEQGAIAGDFLADAFGDKNIAILHDQSAYGQGLAQITRTRLNERGFTETLFEIYAPNEASYDDLVDIMVTAEIDAVYIGGYQADAGIIIRQAKSRLPELQLVSGDSLASEDFPFVAGDAGIGSYFTFGPDARTTTAATTVVDSFRDDEGFEPSGYTLYAYAAVQVWAQAVEMAGTFDTGPVKQVLRENEFDTVLGTLGFDSKGDVTGLKSFIWYQISEDGYAPVE
jgi:branched-chain amino acid transport system substrate-binding protein